jgi:hypothetical protein
MINRGGRVSRKPPPGGMMLAQDPINNQVASKGTIHKNKPPDIAENTFFMDGKGNPKYILYSIYPAESAFTCREQKSSILLALSIPVFPELIG